MWTAAFILLSAIIFAMLFAIKGGWAGTYVKGWKELRNKNKILDRLLDGKTILCVGSLAYFLIVAGVTVYAVLLAAAWVVGVVASMGEENGAVGDSKGGWGDYLDAIYGPDHDDAGKLVFGRSYGVKKAVQRGLFLMTPLAIVTGCGYLAAVGLLYVPVVFAGQELKRRITGVRDWEWTEPALGFICGAAIGVFFIFGG